MESIYDRLENNKTLIITSKLTPLYNSVAFVSFNAEYQGKSNKDPVIFFMMDMHEN